MINALHLIWILPVTMLFGYIVGAVLAADRYQDEPRVWNEHDDDCNDDRGTDDYGYERED